MYSYIFLAKKEGKLKKTYFSSDQVKNNFANFGDCSWK